MSAPTEQLTGTSNNDDDDDDDDAAAYYLSHRFITFPSTWQKFGPKI